MTRVGIRILKLHANEIVNRVEEEQETYEVTVEGEAIAILEPTERRVDPEVHHNYWKWHRQLAEEITKNWEGNLDAVDAVRDQRRDL